MRPLVGITTQAVAATWGEVWSAQVALSPMTIAQSIADAGGRPVLIPPVDTGIDGLVRKLDAVVLAGGPDVDPARYGAERHPKTYLCEIERDEPEFELVRLALDIGLPLLGICRGSQVLNVALGGTLDQHLPDLVGHHQHAAKPGHFNRHTVVTKEGSQLEGIVGRQASVPSFHHQAIATLGTGLRATAWAEDGTIEAAELGEGAPMLGVQWHPEAGEELALFVWLVERAREFVLENSRA